jgi:hypothetical protein
MTGNPAEAAKFFRRDPASIRRWIALGCPVVRRGGKGPGRAALLDFVAVAKWRGRWTAPMGSPPVERTLEIVAEALADCLQHDAVDIRTDATKADAAALFILAFERIAKALGRKHSLDTLPEGIRALMRILYPASDAREPL